MAGEPRRWTGSIRLRITTVAALGVALALLAVSVAVVVLQRRELLLAIDAALAQRADDIASLLEAAEDPSLLLTTGGDTDLVAQIVGPDGSVLAAHRALAGAAPVAAVPAGDDVLSSFRAVPGEDDVFRVLSRRLDDGSAIHVGTSLDTLDDASAATAGALATILPLAVAVIAALVWWLVGRTLSPVEAIRREVDEITATALDRRVPNVGPDDEIGRLASTMNDMLARLDRSMTAQRRFVADASHELRSPLTRMRAELETADDVSREALLPSIHEEVVGMQMLVDDLLHLAQSDSGATVRRNELIDLDDVTRDEIVRLAPSNGVTISIDRLDNGVVRGSEVDLRRVVRNLVDNAVAHATTAVGVEVVAADGTVMLSVTDDGPGVPEDLAEAVFERFRRIDEARSSDAGGTGLGLAIVKDIVERHDGTVSVDATYRSGARLVVVLPAVTD